MNQKFEKWENEIEDIYKDFSEVFFNRYIFWEVQSIIKNNADLENYKPNWFNVFLGQSYFDYVVSAIRRQVKHQKDSVSLVGLLEDIIRNPLILSREGFVKRFVNLHPADEKRAECLFDKRFAGECVDHIDPIIVCQGLCKLKALSKTVEDFADKRVSHHDKRQPSDIPTFNSLDNCMDSIAELIQKYYLLVMAVDLGGDLSVDFTVDWKGIFRQPWILPDAPDEAT